MSKFNYSYKIISSMAHIKTRDADLDMESYILSTTEILTEASTEESDVM